MQTSYLPFSWLKTIEQSIVRNKLIAKAYTPLLRVIALIGKQLSLCDRIIDCFPDIPARRWPDQLSNQNLVPSDIQQTSHLGGYLACFLQFGNNRTVSLIVLSVGF
ncbi:hypothetical protein [Dendronalium sp. ChiSLP03b]|uniref:hypothetical protein n=1 Tax=Dendronalium sp. ChiSLP03b TaxID=3075381 RepID=UPI002AD1E3E3|nr:hypothetical protein [Dendronalium sp. ChiSLP03b]MDZ8206853.1 hypothetical protein [Dendronalium sp. ChiSLP03b]